MNPFYRGPQFPFYPIGGPFIGGFLGGYFGSRFAPRPYYPPPYWRRRRW